MVLADRLLQHFYRRKIWRFFLPLDLPAAQRAFDLSDGVFRFHPSNDRDHHPARTVILAVELYQIIALDILDRFRISVFGPAVGMILEKDLVKDHGSHITR